MTSKDPLLSEFLNRGIKESTYKRDLQVLKQYLQFVKDYTNNPDLTFTILIEQAEDDEDNRLRIRKRRNIEYLRQYHIYLESPELDYALNTAKRHYATLNTFYTHFDIQLPKKKQKFSIKPTTESIEDIPTKEDIITAIGVTGLKAKAMILTMSSSGMDSSTVRNLTLGEMVAGIKDYIGYPTDDFDINHFIKTCREQDDNDIIPYWEGFRSKTEHHEIKYYTFSSPESFTSILDYFEYSHHNTNKPKQLTDYLFPGANGKMSDQNISEIFRRINRHVWNNKKINDHIFFHSHALRKFFSNVLEDNEVGGRSFDHMMGHSLGKVKDAYVKPKKERLLVQYNKALPDLLMEKVIVKDRTSAEIKQIVLENKAKDKRISEVEETNRMMEQQMKRVLKELDLEK